MLRFLHFVYTTSFHTNCIYHVDCIHKLWNRHWWITSHKNFNGLRKTRNFDRQLANGNSNIAKIRSIDWSPNQICIWICIWTRSNTYVNSGYSIFCHNLTQKPKFWIIWNCISIYTSLVKCNHMLVKKPWSKQFQRNAPCRGSPARSDWFGIV